MTAFPASIDETCAFKFCNEFSHLLRHQFTPEYSVASLVAKALQDACQFPLALCSLMIRHNHQPVINKNPIGTSRIKAEYNKFNNKNNSLQ